MDRVRFDENNFAVNDGIVRIYDCDPDTQEYLGFSDERLVSGVGLPAHGFLDAPPPKKEGYTVCRRDGHWQYVVDYRGQTVYDKKTATPITVVWLDELPDSMTRLRPESEFDYWDGARWRTNAEAKRAHDIARSDAEKARRQSATEMRLAILQRAVMLDIATPDEVAELERWALYSVLLNRVDTGLAPDIIWPDAPN